MGETTHLPKNALQISYQIVPQNCNNITELQYF